MPPLPEPGFGASLVHARTPRTRRLPRRARRSISKSPFLVLIRWTRRWRICSWWRCPMTATACWPPSPTEIPGPYRRRASSTRSSRRSASRSEPTRQRPTSSSPAALAGRSQDASRLTSTRQPCLRFAVPDLRGPNRQCASRPAAAGQCPAGTLAGPGEVVPQDRQPAPADVRHGHSTHRWPPQHHQGTRLRDRPRATLRQHRLRRQGDDSCAEGQKWWIYARSWDAWYLDSEWYWNVPVTEDTLILITNGRRQPRY